MKTCTIKPLEWKECGDTIDAMGTFFYWIYKNEEFSLYADGKRSRHETLESAKAKAQELHEAELMKYLQEVAE